MNLEIDLETEANTNAHLNCVVCRQCGGKMKTVDSRPIDMNGVATVWRRKRCLVCAALYRTIEIPEEVGKDLWEIEK